LRDCARSGVISADCVDGWMLGVGANEAKGTGTIATVTVDRGSHEIESRDWRAVDSAKHELVWASGDQIFRQKGINLLRGHERKFTVLIPISRIPDHYLINIVLPMFIIVGSAFSSMFLDKHELADQLSIILTMLLTAVAFQFAVQQSLPLKPYSTWTDICKRIAIYLTAIYLKVPLNGLSQCSVFARYYRCVFDALPSSHPRGLSHRHRRRRVASSAIRQRKYTRKPPVICGVAALALTKCVWLQWLAAHARAVNAIMGSAWLGLHAAMVLLFLCRRRAQEKSWFRQDWAKVIAANRRVDTTKVHNAVFAHYRGWRANDYTGGNE